MQRLVSKFKVSGYLVTPEFRSMSKRSRSSFWPMTPPTVAVEQTFQHHCNPFIKPRRMTYFCLVRVKVKVDPEVKDISHLITLALAGHFP